MISMVASSRKQGVLRVKELGNAVMVFLGDFCKPLIACKASSET